MTTPPSVPPGPGSREGSDDDVPGPVSVDAADRRPPDGTGASSAGPEAADLVPEEQVAGNGAGHGHTSARRRQRRTRRRAPAGSSAASARPDRATAAREAAERARTFGPPLPLAGRPKRVWREQVLVRAGELATLAVWMESRTDGPSSAAAGFPADVDLDLRDVEQACEGFDAVVAYADDLRPTYDLAVIGQEQTVRGQFVRDVEASTLDEDLKHRIMVTGLRALEGRDDLEVPA